MSFFMQLKSFTDRLVIVLKGIFMGCAHAVPGVSGGTVALILGIYERLLSSLASFNLSNLSDLLGSLLNFDFNVLKNVFERMDLFFLFLLGSGILTAVILVLGLIDYLLVENPFAVFGFFFGLIAVSGLMLLKVIEITDLRTKASFVLGILATFIVSGLAIGELGHSPILLFFSGALAVSALIVPGISGSLILVILGQYSYMAESITGFVRSLVDLNPSEGPYIAVLVFIAGAFTGVFTTAHLISRALGKYRDITMAFLVGLVFGGLRAPVLETGLISSDRGLGWVEVFPEFGIAAVFGGVLILALNRYTATIEY